MPFEEIAPIVAATRRPPGELRVVYRLTAGGERITAIDLIADPARLLDLVIAHDAIG